MDRKSEKDDEYWTESAQKGFDFGDDPWPSQSGKYKLSSQVKKNESTKQFDLLRYDGLNEVAENVKTKSTDATDFSNLKAQFPQIKTYTVGTSKSHDPLSLRVKKTDQPAKLTIQQTVRNMVLGLEFSLERFKGKEEKLELLDAAVKSHDGNAIIAVVLFLRNTLKKAIFQREIINFPPAVNMYLSYLEEDHELDELTNMFLLLGKTEEAAMLKYRNALAVEHVDTKIKWLENCLSTHFQSDSIGNILSSAVSQHHQSLIIQKNFEKLHMEQASDGNDENRMKAFEEISGRSSIIDSSVISTTLFSCLYYNHLPETNQFSPLYLKKVFNLSNKQYTWTAIRALAACQKWEDIENMLHSKNWLGGKKIRCCIGFPNVLEVLSKNIAPVELLEKYAIYVEDEEQKLTLAKKYKCHSLVIKILKTAKDRQGLLQFTATLKPHTLDYCNATEALNSTNIKWKN